MSERVARVALALVAVVVIGWSVVLTRDWVVGRAAADRLNKDPRMSAAQWASSLDDLRTAQFLDPSEDWTIERASFVLLRDRRAALRLIQPVVRRQRDYLEAWVVMANAARDFDPRLSARALREMRRLNPVPPEAAKAR